MGYKDNVMTYKYPEMSYKTDTANATGFLNGGFPGYGNRYGYGQFPVNGNRYGYGQFPVNGNLFGSGQFPVNGNRFGYGQFPVYPNLFPMSYNYEYQYPTEISYSAPSFAYKDNVMTYKYPELNYKTDTASATGFINGGFQGFGNLFGYGGYSPLGHSGYRSYGHSGYRRYGRYYYRFTGHHYRWQSSISSLDYLLFKCYV